MYKYKFCIQLYHQEEFESLAQGGASLLTYGYGIPLPLGLAILVSSFLIFPLNERATNAKQVQLMTGLMPSKMIYSQNKFKMIL